MTFEFALHETKKKKQKPKNLSAITSVLPSPFYYTTPEWFSYFHQPKKREKEMKQRGNNVLLFYCSRGLIQQQPQKNETFSSNEIFIKQKGKKKNQKTQLDKRK